LPCEAGATAEALGSGKNAQQKSKAKIRIVVAVLELINKNDFITSLGTKSHIYAIAFCTIV
jgi:hypothetical protein